MSDGGKGSAQRPGDQATYRANFDRIFGKGPRPEFMSKDDPQPVVQVVLPEGRLRESANDDQAE